MANGAQIFLGNGDGTMRTPPTLADNRGATVVVAEDFNGDGRPDLVRNTGFDKFSVLINDGNWSPVVAPSVSISDVTIGEGNAGTRTATFTVNMSAAYSQSVLVRYAIANGTATAGSDYQASAGR